PYDVQSWTATGSGRYSMYGGFRGPPIDVPRPPDAPLQVPTRELTQTFYVQTPMPNVIFAAYRPASVYFPVDRIAIDTYSSIRSPVEIEAGTIYSVVSDLPAPSVESLRMADPMWPPETVREYTQLPSELPQRDVDLAHRLLRGPRVRRARVGGGALPRRGLDRVRPDPLRAASGAVARQPIPRPSHHCRSGASAREAGWQASRPGAFGSRGGVSRSRRRTLPPGDRGPGGRIGGGPVPPARARAPAQN